MANADEPQRAAEFGPTLTQLEGVTALLVAAAPDAGSGDDLRRYAVLVDRLGDIAACDGLLGLLDVCLLYGGVLESLIETGASLDDATRKTLAVWPGLVRLYLRKPDLPATGAALVAHLCRPCWGTDMSVDDMEQLADSLATLPPGAGDGPPEPIFGDDPPVGDLPLEDSAMQSGASTGMDLDNSLHASMYFDRTLQSSAAGPAPPAAEPLEVLPLPIDGEVTSLLCSTQFSGAHDAEHAEGGASSLFDETLVNLDAPAQFDDSPLLADPIPLLADPIDEIPAPVQSATDAAPGERTLSSSALELLGVIIDELPEVETALDALTGLATCPGVERELVEEAYANAINVLERVAAAAESIGLAGLTGFCALATANLVTRRDAPDAMDGAQPALWRGFVPALRAYLEAPLDAEPIGALAAFAADARHASPMAGDALDELQTLLGKPDFAALEVQMPARPSVATDEDVSLDVPKDVNPELLDGLLQELPQQTEEFSSAIQRLIRGGSLDDVNIAQRVAHTLKGAGNTVGVRGLAELTHQIEDVLLALAKHEVLPTRALADTMMNAADCLEGMTESLLGIGPAPVDRRQVLQSVLDWANRIDREGPPRDAEAPAQAAQTQAAPTQAALASAGAAPLHAAAADRDERAPADGPGAAPEVAGDSEREAGGAMLRVPARIVDDLLRLVGEAIILSSQLHDGVRRTQLNARMMEDQFEHLRTLGGELERLVDVKDFSTGHAGQRRATGFDALEMDQYSELHTYSRRLIEAALDAREMGRSVIGSLSQLDDMLTTQETLNRDTHEGVLNTRLVPVKSFFPRLQRSARQASRLTAKQVELDLAGGETLMDSEVLGQIVDPLMHLLRNAIDHGIEAPEVRLARGKSEEGRVSLEFLRDGSNILVRCRDDGAGLDFEAIRLAAERRGLLAEGEEASEEDLKNLILRPNFTTRTHATQTSGRGVGLDVVYGRIAELGGALTIRSNAGLGCVFDVRLPVTLLSSHALLVRAGAQTIAITSRGLEQIVHVDDGELRQFGSELVFQVADQVYPAQCLDAVLGIAGPTARAGKLSPYRSVLLVRRNAGLVAVLVESIVASRELVVKTLGAYIPKLRGIVGGTILGDGSVTAVIDVAELLREHVQLDATRTVHGTTPAGETTSLPLAMVVDDSLSARRALAQLLSDSGFKVLTARDGMEAVEALETASPDIMFVDLEMPRMNGIELTMHVRAKPQMAKVPVIMVTSRSTAKHRQQAETAGVNAYITKPFAEEMVLEHTRDLLASA